MSSGDADHSAAGRVTVGGVPVRGVNPDSETRCDHYASERDVIAIRFPCCDVFYPCYRCHRTLADHEIERWSRDRFDERAVLCGSCGTRLQIEAYLQADHACPACETGFNPGCADHYALYFDVDSEA